MTLPSQSAIPGRIEKGIFLRKRNQGLVNSGVTRSWQGFENDEPLGKEKEDDFPGDKATEPLQTEKQSKNQLNQKKKKRAKIHAVTSHLLISMA